jgi:hypothetical protein
MLKKHPAWGVFSINPCADTRLVFQDVACAPELSSADESRVRSIISAEEIYMADSTPSKEQLEKLANQIQQDQAKTNPLNHIYFGPTAL